MALPNFTIKSLREGLLKKEFSALEVTQNYIKEIKEKDSDIGAYLAVLQEESEEEAKKVDGMIADGKELPPLAGIPVALKDNILVKGAKATAASQILKDYTASYDAGATAKLKEQNAILIGKTNLDEFAMGASTENSGFHPTKNPLDKTRVPGGSSGGSAAAVAANMAVAALGSDTGGSIRQPAAFCGLTGMKPTYGAVSRSGLIALASSLDQIGPLTKTTEDAAILFNAIAGYDKMDATSVNYDYAEKILNPDFEKIKKLKIGIPEEYFVEGLDPEVERAINFTIERFKSLGLDFQKISLPHTKYGIACYYIVLTAEASANLGRFDGIRYSTREKGQNLRDIYELTRGKLFGSEPKRRIILGTFVLSSGYYDAYYEKAQKIRTLIKQDFEKAFEKVDVILAPVTPTPPFKLGEKANDPLAMYLADVFTVAAPLAGIPAISIPTRADTTLPVGFQLMGKMWHEPDLLGLGELYEKELLA